MRRSVAVMNLMDYHARMRRIAWLGLLLAGCSSAPSPGPAAPSRQASRAIGDAIDRLRLAVGYASSFQAELHHPKGVATTGGRAEWFRSGVLKARLDQPGEPPVTVLGVGMQIWVCTGDPRRWLKPDQVARPGTGSGVETPESVLSALRLAAGAARWVGEIPGDGASGVVELPMRGDILRMTVGGLAASLDPRWGEATGAARATIVAGTLRELRLQSRVPLEAGGEARFEATMAFEPLGGAALKADETEAPWSDEMKSAVEKAKGSER